MNLAALHRTVRRIWIGLGLSVTAVMIWSVGASGVPAGAFASDADITVADTTYGLTFTPRTPRAGTPGLVVLPGGMVDPDAYVPLVRAIAEAGIPAALVELPWRSAPTPPMRAVLWERIRSAIADVGGRAVLAGHSRGGMFAATFVADQPAAVEGLILIGTTHPRDRDLSQAALAVLKIGGTLDCVATGEAARANAGLLPADTLWIEIDGGNHQNFANYHWQFNDCRATISREEQQRQTSAAILSFLDRLPPSNSAR